MEQHNIDTYIKNENGEINIFIEGQKYKIEEIPAFKLKMEQYEIRIGEQLETLTDLRRDKHDLRERIKEQSLLLSKTIQEKEDFEKKYQETIRNIAQLNTTSTTNDEIYQKALSLFLALRLEEALEVLEETSHQKHLEKTAQEHKNLGKQAILKANIYEVQNNSKEKNKAYEQATQHLQITIIANPEDHEAWFGICVS